MDTKTHDSQDCPECRGAGEVTIPHFSGDPQCESQVTCSECDGSGDAQPINQTDEE